jgi:hypothetical protein
MHCSRILPRAAIGAVCRILGDFSFALCACHFLFLRSVRLSNDRMVSTRLDAMTAVPKGLLAEPAPSYLERPRVRVLSLASLAIGAGTPLRPLS